MKKIPAILFSFFFISLSNCSIFPESNSPPKPVEGTIVRLINLSKYRLSTWEKENRLDVDHSQKIRLSNYEWPYYLQYHWKIADLEIMTLIKNVKSPEMVTIAILPDYFKDKTLNSMIHYLELDCDDIKTEYKTSTGCSYLLYKEKKYLGEINISDGLDKIIFRIDKTGDY